jgi:hypothetical protein
VNGKRLSVTTKHQQINSMKKQQIIKIK